MRKIISITCRQLFSAFCTKKGKRVQRRIYILFNMALFFKTRGRICDNLYNFLDLNNF